jgi:N-acetylneuraminate synthase
MQTINLGNETIGDGQPVYVIAEAGVNHNGSLDKALSLVNVAKAAGANAVKFQLFDAEEQVSRSARTADYQQSQTGQVSMLEMARDYDLPWETHREIKKYCDELDITYMASCFDQRAVDFYLELGGNAIKVGSGEITNYPLLGYMASTNKPILLSTGMSTLEDVAGAVAHIKANGSSPLALFQCTSEYPTEPSNANLRAINTLKTEFGVPVGYSDHTRDNIAVVAAVALGACIVEKHFTLDRTMAGPDHHMSLNPDELHTYVQSIRTTELALGDGVKVPTEAEKRVAKAARRSLVSSRAILVGECLSDENVTLKRPAAGIDPRLWATVRGRQVNVAIPADAPITWDLLV